VFGGEVEAITTDLDLLKSQDPTAHDRTVLVVFWFAIHLENLELASALVEKEQSVKEVVAYLYC
jgi:hypothetical protein